MNRRPVLRTLLAAVTLTLFSLSAFSGCQVAPSKTARGAGIGTVGGALGGAAIGSASGNAGAGAAIGAGAGAAVGALVGLTQEMKERKQQDILAQERAYQQEVARKRQEEARRQEQIEEELAIAQGFRISDAELNDAQRRSDETSSRLAELQAEREWALNRKKQLDETEEKIEAETAEIARLESELAELRGAGALGSP